jgi:hypothetical protein
MAKIKLIFMFFKRISKISRSGSKTNINGIPGNTQ